MKKSLRGIAVVLFVMFLGAAVLTIPGEAAKKVSTRKLVYCDYTLAKNNMKKPINLKVGKTIVKCGDYNQADYATYHGYVRFTAKKKKKYTLTFSNLIDPNSPSGMGYVETFITSKQGKKWVTYKNVSTQGGKTGYLYIGENDTNGGSKKTSHLKSRYAKIKLKKGETLYMFFSFIKGAKLDVDVK